MQNSSPKAKRQKSKTRQSTPTLEGLVREFEALRVRFDPDSAQRRSALIAGLSDTRMHTASVSILMRLHEALHFALAYPDDENAVRAALAALEKITDVVSSRPVDAAGFKQLTNSGIGGALNECSFSLDLCEWLIARLGEAAQVGWADGTAGNGLSELLPIISAAVDADGLLDDSLGDEEWIRLARGGLNVEADLPRRGGPGGSDTDRSPIGDRPRESDLAWLARRFAELSAPRAVRDRLWEELDLPVRWTLDAPRSRTFLRFPRRPVFCQCEPVMRQTDVAALLATPLPAPLSLTAGATQELIDVARMTLAVRQRETDPVTYANPHEITLFQLERGVDVALFGMIPERRLPIESYFGFIAARNRMPCAYGGGWVFFDRAEIGVNIFDTFRGGESAYLFSQILRVYAQHYCIRRFAVDPFQFGKDNEEAIESGAYWFYHRLGFRSSAAPQAALAESQAAKIARNARHRTPPAMLCRLAESSLELELRGAPPTADAAALSQDVPLARLSLAATRWIGERFAGDRGAAQTWATERVCGALAVQPPMSGGADAVSVGGVPAPWTAASWTAFSSLSPLFAMIPDLEGWPALDRRAAATILRAKGAARERDYALALQQHGRLRRAWAEAAAVALPAQR